MLRKWHVLFGQKYMEIFQKHEKSSSLMYRASTPCLSLWERWLSEAKTERGNKAAIPSQSPSVTALPEGEPRGCMCWHKK